MTIDAGKQAAKTANMFHADGKFDKAVNSYTKAAYEYLGANGLNHSVSVARGLQNLIIGATCLRYQGHMDDCQNRCWQGIYVCQAAAEEAMARPRASHPHDQSERGIYYEFEADFRVVGALPNAESAYDRAGRAYRDASDPQCVSCEQFHLATADLTKLIIYGSDTDPDKLHAVLRPESTLTDWIEFKRCALPELMECLDDGMKWEYVH